jgi:hypothetical protein
MDIRSQWVSIVARRRTSESSPLSRLGFGSLRKATFGVGLELPSDTSDKVLLVAAPAILAEERFETLDHFGDRHSLKACDLGRRCSVHG